jgi:hypothetical protein
LYDPNMEIRRPEETAMERTATVRATDLSPTLREWVRDLLHTEPTDAAELTVTLRQPGAEPTPEQRTAARKRLLEVMQAIGDRTKDIPQGEIDAAVDEAMQFVRSHPTDAHHS